MFSCLCKKNTQKLRICVVRFDFLRYVIAGDGVLFFDSNVLSFFEIRHIAFSCWHLLLFCVTMSSEAVLLVALGVEERAFAFSAAARLLFLCSCCSNTILSSAVSCLELKEVSSFFKSEISGLTFLL